MQIEKDLASWRLLFYLFYLPVAISCLCVGLVENRSLWPAASSVIVIALAVLVLFARGNRISFILVLLLLFHPVLASVPGGAVPPANSGACGGAPGNPTSKTLLISQQLNRFCADFGGGQFLD